MIICNHKNRLFGLSIMNKIKLLDIERYTINKQIVILVDNRIIKNIQL